MRQRVILRRAIVAILLLLFVDVAAWAFLCRRLEQGIRAAVAAAPQSGWSIGLGSTHWAGWPFAAAIDVSAISAEGGLLPDFVWRADRARVELSLFHPTTLSLAIGEAQSVEAEGIPKIPVSASRTIIAVDLTERAPVAADIVALTAMLPAGNLTLDHADLTLPPNALTADLTGLSLPGVTTPIGTIRLRLDVDPALPVSDDPQASARAWRQAGGHIDITDVVLRWDALDAAGSGRITLDDQLQPQAEGSVQASGLPRLLDDLAKAGALAPAQAGAAKAVIAILAAPAGGNRVQLPISLADGVLSLARFPLARFRPLVWN